MACVGSSTTREFLMLPPSFRVEQCSIDEVYRLLLAAVQLIDKRYSNQKPTILTDNGFSDSTALRVSVALGLTYLIAQLIGLGIIMATSRTKMKDPPTQ